MAFASNLKRAMEAQGMTHEDLAKVLGVSRPAVSQWLSGGTQPVGKRLAKIAAALSTTVRALFDGDHLEEINAVPIVSYVGAGEEVFLFEEHGLSGPLDKAPMPPGGDENLLASVVRGNSMVPAFWEGDVLYYPREDHFERAECLYRQCVVKVTDGPILVKHIMPGKTPHTYNLMSFNAAPIYDVELEWGAPVKFHDMTRRNTKVEMSLLTKPKRARKRKSTTPAPLSAS